MTIPKSDLLRRKPLKSASDGSYSPYTQYFEFDHPIFAEWVQKSKNLKDEKLSPLYEIESVIQHELAHWIQSHGTSTGVFQSILRGGQLDLFLLVPDRFGQAFLDLLVPRRVGADNLPFIRTKGSNLIADPLESQSGEFAVYRQQWFDLQLTQQLFHQPKKLFKSKHSLSTAIRYSLDLANLYKEPKLKNEDFYVYPNYADFEDDENFIRNELAGKLDVVALFEGFATANQCLYYTLYQLINKSAWLENRLALTIKSISESNYGNAFRYFVGVCPAAKDDIIKGLVVFCAIADLSLHPKLEKLDTDYLSCNTIGSFFTDIYPPSRFIRLCEAANKAPLISLNSNHETILQYQRDLLSRAGIEVSEKFLARHLRLESIDSLVFNAETLKNYTVTDVETYWQKASVKTRDLYPALYVLPSPQYIYGRQWLSDLRSDQQLKNVLQPPLWSDKKKHIYFGIAENPSHCLIFWSVAASVIFDVTCGTRVIDLSMFPEDVLASGIAEDALGAVFRHLGFEADIIE